MREGDSFGASFSLEIDPSIAVFVPRGVGNSYQTLEDDTSYTYLVNDHWHAGATYPALALDDPTVEQVTGETYGPLKALCEQAAEAAMPGRTLVIRPGLIVGPDDPTDRFTYWPVRISRGGQVLAPSGPDYGTEIIDVRDLAEWTIRMVEGKVTGIFNAAGSGSPLTLGDVLETSREVCAPTPNSSGFPNNFYRKMKCSPGPTCPCGRGKGPNTLALPASIAARPRPPASLIGLWPPPSGIPWPGPPPARRITRGGPG